MSDVLKWLQNMANEEWEYEDGDYALEAIKFFNSLRAENERLREALRSILSFPAKPLHLTRDYRIRLPEHVLFEAASIFEQSCKEAKRAVFDGVTEKEGAENE